MDAPWGVVEGFYGALWSFEERTAAVDFAVEAGLDTWMYAPKDDPRHRARWREPYPQEWLEHFGALAERIQLVYGIAPALDYEQGDQWVLEDKLLTLYGAGVRHFCVLFDDVVGERYAAEGAVQVAMITGVRRALPEDASLCFVSNSYAGTAAEMLGDVAAFDPLIASPSSSLYSAYEDIDPSVSVFWTGPHVFSAEILESEVEAFRELVGRPVVLWDNFPVNDTNTEELFLDAVPHRPGFDGVLINPMVQPAVSRIAMWTHGLARGGNYDPDVAREAAHQRLGGDQLASLAEHHASHPYLEWGLESEALMEAWNAGEDLGPLFEDYAACSVSELEPDLAAELDAACAQLSLYGEAGLAMLAGGDVDTPWLAARELPAAVGENRSTAVWPLISGQSNPRDAFAEVLGR